MVGLDLTEMDDQIISYLPIIEEIFEPDAIYFVHVAKSLTLPTRVREKYPDLMAPMDESLISDMRRKIGAHYTPKGNPSLHYTVLEGDPIKEILNWTGIKEIDLFVMGRKRELTGEGKLSNRLARVAHCSIFFVPQHIRKQMKRVLVPVDFSNTSGMALDFAMKLREHHGVEVILQNSYEVPSGYHLTGKTYEEFSEIMRKNALDDSREFLKKHKFSEKEVTVKLCFDEEDDPGERAYEAARELKADLIIIASRGRSGFASILLGSVAEKMIRYDSDIPLLIVKNKKENLGFFQALLRI
jgi:nucleotide-binding universal stress UspA family protein